MDNNLQPAFTFSLDYLETIAGSDKDFMAEMITMFLSQTPPQIDLLNLAINKLDYEQIANIAHKVKPTFTMFGLNSVQQSFSLLENDAKAGAPFIEIEKKMQLILPVLKMLYTRLELEKKSL